MTDKPKQAKDTRFLKLVGGSVPLAVNLVKARREVAPESNTTPYISNKENQ